MKNEKWQQVPTYPKYEVSNFGRVRNAQKGTLLNAQITRKGYERVTLYNNEGHKSLFVHRLVLWAWTRERKDLGVAHFDGNPRNNCLKNLRWATYQENANDSIRLGTQVRGERHGCAKISDHDAEEIRRRYVRIGHNRSNAKSLADEFGLTVSYVRQLAAGQFRKALEGCTDE